MLQQGRPDNGVVVSHYFFLFLHSIVSAAGAEYIEFIHREIITKRMNNSATTGSVDEGR